MDQSGKNRNKFLRIPETSTILEAIQQIPKDMGEFSVSEQKIPHNIVYYDWIMQWKQDFQVEKSGDQRQDTIQIVFFLNHGMCWKAEEISHPIDMSQGEFCMYRDFSKSIGLYEGGKKLLFQSIQIPTSYFTKLLSYYLEDGDQRQILRMIAAVKNVQITPGIYQILETMKSPGPYRRGICNLYMESKITELIACCLEVMLDLDDKNISMKCMSKSDMEALMKIKQRIDLHCTDIPKIEVLAKEEGIGPGKLMKGFKELTGKSLHAYIIDQRLTCAAVMLESGKYNVSQAAISCGYTNMSHFSAAFKKKYGILPKHYKKC